MHFVGSAVLALSLLMLSRLLLRLRRHGWSSDGRAKSVETEDLIAFGLFTFTGLALSTIGVYIRKGSPSWHAWIVLVWVAVAALTERDNRMALLRAKETKDTWSAPDSAEVVSKSGVQRRVME
eukprot:Hpha_TRINITY_DN16515_c1_g7::TRINITY_DN16515_c1_g7_i2::g.133859::m.133859